MRYEEKAYYGEGNGTGQRILNPVTNIEIGENSVFTLDTVQIRGVDSTIRTTNVVMDANSKLFVLERLMTDGDQKAESDIGSMYERKRFFRTDYFTFCRKGQFLPGLPSQGQSAKQMPRPYPVRFYHHGSRTGRIYSGDPGKACG